MSNLPSSFFFQENPRKRNITTAIVCPLGLGLGFQQLRATAGCLFEIQDHILHFYGERKSHTLSTPDLLILYKFSLPALGAAVNSFVYLHSNTIMKTQSGFKKTLPPKPSPGLTHSDASLAFNGDIFFHSILGTRLSFDDI